jgi:hypothetical protein
MESPSPNDQKIKPTSEDGIVILDGNDPLWFARIQSKRYPHRQYNVFYNSADDFAACECDGWFNSAAKDKGKCWHVDALKARVASIRSSSA